MLPAVEMASPASVRNNKAVLYNKICSVIWKSNFSLMFTSPRKLASSPTLMSSGNKSILFNLYSCRLKDLAAVETRCIMLKLELNPHIDIHVGWLLRYRELEERNVGEKKTSLTWIILKQRQLWCRYTRKMRGKGGCATLQWDRVFSSDLEIGSNYVVLSGVERSLRHWEHREKRAEVLNSIWGTVETVSGGWNGRI